MSDQPQIHELILGNFHHSMAFLSEFFGLDSPSFDEMAPFVKVLAALRALPREAMDDVVKPILTEQFAAFYLDPKDADDRRAAAKLSDIFALGIQDATNMIMQVMQSHQASAHALRAGKGNLLV